MLCRRRFNPHPAFGPGATGDAVGGCCAGAVSILTRPSGRVLLCWQLARPPHNLVSILTRPSGRVLLPFPPPSFRLAPVSILTRPSGRVLHQRRLYRAGHGVVSILTRPSGRVLPDHPAAAALVADVSILTRPSGRVLPFAPGGGRSRAFSFNPHPAFGPGATHWGRIHPDSPFSFNPHPAFGPGATPWFLWRGECRLRVSILTRPSGRVLPAAANALYERYLVSILTRPSGRVLRRTRRSTPATPESFNPHPAFGPGATSDVGRYAPLPQSVSILTRPSGRVLLRCGDRYCAKSCSFNPHPAFGPGATWRQYRQPLRLAGVSILTRPSGRVLLVQCGMRIYFTIVSILTRPSGRVLRHSGLPLHTGRARFQSSPGLRAGCYARIFALAACASLVSILTRPSGRVLPGLVPGLPRAGSGFNPHPAFGPGATFPGC